MISLMAARVDHRAQQALGDLVGHAVGGMAGVEIALKRVHHDVHHAAADLIAWERIGQLGVHDGEERTLEVGVQSALERGLIVREHGAVARLAAGGGDGQHRAEPARFGERRLLAPEIPDVRFGVGDAVGDGLGRVHHAAAADAENEVRAEGERLLHALARVGQARVGLHAAEAHVLKPCVGERLLDARDKPALHGAVAAVDDKDLRALAEIDLSRSVKFKCLHGIGPPCLRAEWSARVFSAPMVAHLRAHCKRSNGREKAHFLRDFVLT